MPTYLTFMKALPCATLNCPRPAEEKNAVSGRLAFSSGDTSAIWVQVYLCDECARKEGEHVIDYTSNISGTLYLDLTPGCAPVPGMNAVSLSSTPYTMITTTELEQLRAENARLVAAEKVAQVLLDEVERLRARVAELEDGGPNVGI